MHGILLVDKPEGMTSNDVVQRVKRRVKPAKVGHTGTLDPAATGLLVILIGSATRILDYIDESRKAYFMTVKLGEETDTDDREGTVTRTDDPGGIGRDEIEEALRAYRGVIDQVPPRYSAVKKNGVPLYKLARQGIYPDVPPRKVEIFSLEILGWNSPFLEMLMQCSKGTFARALARDLGRDLGVGGRLESLERRASGAFHLEAAVSLDEVEQGGADFIATRLIDLPTALAHIPDVAAYPAEVKRLMRGTSAVLTRNRLPQSSGPDTDIPRLMKIVSGEGDLVILVRPQPRGPDAALRPVRVFKTWEG